LRENNGNELSYCHEKKVSEGEKRRLRQSGVRFDLVGGPEIDASCATECA